MDKETPRSHTSQSSPKNEPESTSAIPAEPISNPRLQNPFERPNPTTGRTGFGLFAQDEINPRTVPRWIPSQRVSQPPRSDEEGPQLNYEQRTGPNPQLSSAGSYQVVSPGTGSTRASVHAGPHRNTREIGQSTVGEESYSQPSEVAAESARSLLESGDGSSSTANVTSSDQSRGQELHLRDTVYNSASCVSNPSEEDIPSTKKDVQECPRLSRQNPGRWTPGNADYSNKPGVRNWRLSRDATLMLSRHEPFQAPRQIVEHELSQVDSQLDVSNPPDTGNGHGSKDSSVSASPLSTPGLDVTGFQERLRSISNPSTPSTDPSECSDSEKMPSKNEPRPGSVAPDALMVELTTCLLFSWFYYPIVLDFPRLVENFRKCPNGSGADQPNGSPGNRPLVESHHQDQNGSFWVEHGDEGSQEDDDQSKQPEQSSQKTCDSPKRPPRPLACPFHKMDPLRYSGRNELEKEYRNCASGYYQDISRLK
jgi:hypothetical protein